MSDDESGDDHRAVSDDESGNNQSSDQTQILANYLFWLLCPPTQLGVQNIEQLYAEQDWSNSRLVLTKDLVKMQDISWAFLPPIFLNPSNNMSPNKLGLDNP